MDINVNTKRLIDDMQRHLHDHLMERFFGKTIKQTAEAIQSELERYVLHLLQRTGNATLYPFFKCRYQLQRDQLDIIPENFFSGLLLNGIVCVSAAVNHGYKEYNTLTGTFTWEDGKLMFAPRMPVESVTITITPNEPNSSPAE